MKTNFCTILLLMFMLTNLYSQTEKIVTLKTGTGDLEGTLMTPESNSSKTVALLIAGSGPTDRDGNNLAMKNNSLKMLATELVKNGIASLRYDKRGIGNSKTAGFKEADIRFENYVNDAKEWIIYLKKELKFNHIVVIGHSEGSLIGMIASQGKEVSKFVSVAGAGQAADKIIREQLKSQPPSLTIQVNAILDEFVKGKTVQNTPPELNSLFRQSVQPYLISWFKYDPQKEIAKLRIPVLIIQGTTDIQVGLDDANRLAKALPKAKLVIIEGMNHILKPAPADRQMNILTYTQPDLAIKKELIDNIIPFIIRK
ncbi:MAG: alpha/beta hydrolase [Bacteroidia bacterium]|nr:alpha/beta hydrolase [Bacteroidia bacterium]